MNYFIIFQLFICVLSYRFAPIHKFVLPIQNEKVGLNIIERCEIIQKNTPCILFLTGGSGMIPPQIYGNFMDNLATNGFTICTPHSQIKNRKYIINFLNDIYKEVIVVGHSSGGTTAINYAKNKYVKKLILIDPVDTRLFSKEYRNKTHELENLESILFINAGKSYKITFSPFSLPFIPFLSIQTDIIKTNKNCIINQIEANNFGHADILDLHYSNIMHNSRICVGFNNRTFDNIVKYHEWLTYIFYHFSRENSKKLKKLPYSFIKWN